MRRITNPISLEEHCHVLILSLSSIKPLFSYPRVADYLVATPLPLKVSPPGAIIGGFVGSPIVSVEARESKNSCFPAAFLDPIRTRLGADDLAMVSVLVYLVENVDRGPKTSDTNISCNQFPLQGKRQRA